MGLTARSLTIVVAAICGVAFVPPVRAVVLAPGALVGTTLTQAWLIDPATGQHQVFADGSSSSTFFDDIASSPDGSIKVITSNATSGDGVARVDPATETVTPLAGGFTGGSLSNLDVGSSGTIYALQNASGNPTTFQSNSLFAINPATGMTSTVFNNTATTGPTPGINVQSLSLLPGGLAAFIGFGSSLTGNAGVYIYNFATGSATLLVQGGPLTIAPGGFGEGSAAPNAITTLPNGQLLIASIYGQGFVASNMFEVNPTTGVVTPVGSVNGWVSDIDLAKDGASVYLANFRTRSFGVDQFVLGSTTSTAIVEGLSQGIEIAVVAPEPSSVTLTALGIGILALVGRRSQGVSRSDHEPM
jgi:hypothetical protein